MLRSTKDLEKYSVSVKDGDIGKMHSFLFSDEDFRIRYTVVDTGKWIPDRRVLIHPSHVVKILSSDSVVVLDLTRDKIDRAPEIEEKEPAHMEARKKRLDKMSTVMWEPIFQQPGGIPYYPNYLAFDMDMREKSLDEEVETNIRSTREIEGYDIIATDGKIGHVEDFIADVSESWKIRYLVVDTRDFLPSKKVIISPDWVKEFSWERREVLVDHTKKEIKNSPEFDPTVPVNRKYEEVLFDYYGRPKYWK